MARVIEFEQTGGPENLRLVERDMPPPAAHEVQVSMKATGLNRAELMFLAGQYLVQPKSPARIGVEGAGVIIAKGDAVHGFSVGQRVSITPNLNPAEYGVLGEVANVPVVALQPIPDSMSDIEAASFWMAYPTAWGGLVQAGGLRADSGQAVLISAASSSVGIAAIQIAREYGATVIATTRTRNKADFVRDVGAKHVVVTDEESLVDRVGQITEGHGIDIAFDPVGGTFVETLAQAAAQDAVIVEYGLLAGENAPLPFFAMIQKGVSIRTFHLGYDLMQFPDRAKQAFEHLLPRVASGTYRAIVDKVYSLEQAGDAYRRLASNQQLGKVVIEVA